MDHARKIGKIDTPISWSQKRSPPCLIYDRGGSTDDEVEEDRRLVNWNKWLKNREKHYRHYEQRCDRDRDDLLMIKDLDDFRAKFAVENIEESVGDVNRSSKDRGNPAFWVTPEFLSKRGHPDWPDIAVTLTENQTYGKSMIERVALPDLIKREKGLPVSREQRIPKKTNYQRAHERNVPADRIKVLARKERDINQLAIKGERWKQKTAKRVPKILVTSVETLKTLKSDDGSQSEVIERDYADRAIVLMIQDREVTWDKRISLNETDESYSDRLTWSLTFKSIDFHASKREIRIENRGNYAITYRWRHNVQNTSFLLSMPQNSYFFFNKNKGLILPGQIIILPVCFRSRLPRIATEFWTLTTEPPVCQESLNFRFWGIATLSTNFHSNVFQSSLTDFTGYESIEKYLDRRVRDAKIHGIITSIIDDVQQNDSPVVSYDSLFVESELFHAKNPMHFYHSDLIRDLRKIYENVTSSDSPSWGLSLMELRRILLIIKDPEVRNEKLLRFNELCLESLKSSLFHTTRNEKGTMVYNLLCSFANKFEEESDYVAFKCSPVEISTGKNSGEISPADISRSAASMTSSQGSMITPRKKNGKTSRLGSSKTTSKTSISMSTNNRVIVENLGNEKDTKSCFLFKEVFRIRIREILTDTILAICAVVDTYNNFSPDK